MEPALLLCSTTKASALASVIDPESYRSAYSMVVFKLKAGSALREHHNGCHLVGGNVACHEDAEDIQGVLEELRHPSGFWNSISQFFGSHTPSDPATLTMPNASTVLLHTTVDHAGPLVLQSHVQEQDGSSHSSSDAATFLPSLPLTSLLLTADSSVSRLIGKGGGVARNLRAVTGCFIQISSRVDVLLYTAELSLSACDSEWPETAATLQHNLLSPEAAQEHTKRELIEYLRKVAPSGVLLQHSLLDSISKAVKRKSTESEYAAILEVFRPVVEVPTSPSVSKAIGIAEAQPEVFQFEVSLGEKLEVASDCNQKKKRVIRFFPAEANTESHKAPPEKQVKVADDDLLLGQTISPNLREYRRRKEP